MREEIIYLCVSMTSCAHSSKGTRRGAQVEISRGEPVLSASGRKEGICFCQGPDVSLYILQRVNTFGGILKCSAQGNCQLNKSRRRRVAHAPLDHTGNFSVLVRRNW